MNIKQEEKETKGRFFIEKDGAKAAEMTYSKAGTSRIIIDHTEVSDDFRGQGLGVQLVEKAADYAREHNLTILPLCPFARSIFERKPELGDVLK